MVPRFALPAKAMSTAGVPPRELFLTVEPANYPEDVQATRIDSRNCRLRSDQQESTVGLLPDAEGESHWDAPEQKCGEPMSCQIGRTASNKKSPQPPDGDCGQLLNYRVHQVWNGGDSTNRLHRNCRLHLVLANRWDGRSRPLLQLA